MQHPALLLLLATFALFFTTSCDPASLLGPKAKNADQYDLRVRYHRGSCYGRCEVFTLDVFDNGLLVFEGERFTDRPGTWEKSIDRRRIVALLDSFARADFPNYPPSFRGEVPDAPTVSISYFAEGKTYETSFKDYAPQELHQLDQALLKLAMMPNYRQVTDSIDGGLIRAVSPKEPEEIIVHLREDVVAETWIVKYGKQNVVLKHRISPNGSYYLITADPNLMPAAELLDYLRQDPDVNSAQLNASVRPR